MRRTRSSSLASAPQRLRSLRSRNPPLTPPPVASLRRSRRQTPVVKLEEEEDDEEEEDEESEEDEEESEEEQVTELTEYERKRRENIQRNLAFMQQMGVSTAKIAARTLVGNEAGKETKRQQLAIKRALQASIRAERLTQPVRKSRRLEGKTVEMEANEAIDQFEMDMKKAPRALRVSYMNVMDTVDKESKSFLGGITADMEEQFEYEDTFLDDDDGVEYTLADDDIIKAVQERVYSVAFLPRADRVVVACGDKLGHVALWTPPSEADVKLESAGSSLAVYRPHHTPVSQLIFSDSSKLISSSFDGTVKEFDLRVAESSVVYETNDGAGISSLAVASKLQCFYASCDDGTVRLIDRRASQMKSSSYTLHEKKINTVSQHPSLDFCIATASLDRTVCLWDARKLSATKNTPLVSLPHYRSVNCAYFSPRGGAWLVTVGQDSYIDMFDTSSLTDCKVSDNSGLTLPDSIRVRHNNITGRWLTKLHAAWDPKRPNQFVIGCMEQPRRIQIFRAGRRRPMRELKSSNFASVHSINAFHPHLELIAGGNSSGRLSLWRGKETVKADETNESIKTER